jgi:hypothetical protein
MERNVIVNRAKYDITPENKDIRKGKAVMCITTGEVFKSAREAANYYGIGYASLTNQIAGRQKTCGGAPHNHTGNGKQFCYISEMGYNVAAISASIIEMKRNGVSREDYDAAMMRNDELETEKAMLQFKNRELQEELNSYKERFDRCYSALVGQRRK